MRGTWIEIQKLLALIDVVQGRPSCEGRGLKFFRDTDALDDSGRPSCEGRGLKLKVARRRS